MNILSESTSQANSIFISGNDVYTAGQENKGINLLTNGKIWKNGISILTTNYYDCKINDVIVLNNVVFAVGTRKDENNGIICTLWKDGFAYDLQEKTNYCDVFSLKINNNIVYCVGYSRKITRNIATMWAFKINDNQIVKVEYSDPNLDSELFNLCFDLNNNLYLVGQSFDSFINGVIVNGSPFFQKNGDPKQILTIGTNNGTSIGIHVSESKTIISGYQVINQYNITQACYWENGIQTLIFPSQKYDYLSEKDFKIKKSFLFEDRLFMCGSKISNNKFSAIFLDESQKVNIMQTDKSTEAFDIYVTSL